MFGGFMNEAMIFVVTIEHKKCIYEQMQKDTCQFKTLEVNFYVFVFLEKASSTPDNRVIVSSDIVNYASEFRIQAQ